MQKCAGLDERESLGTIGLRKLRALPLTQFPPLNWGDDSGAILDSIDHDCNMKIDPARRCSCPPRPTIGPAYFRRPWRVGPNRMVTLTVIPILVCLHEGLKSCRSIATLRRRRPAT